MLRKLSQAHDQGTTKRGSPCEHRAVSVDGRIICRKIAQGENAVSPDLCRSCPSKKVNCSHLRFSLVHSSPSPLLVRFNGRTELWDDETPEIRIRQAGCSVHIIAISHPNICSGCSVRQPIHSQAEQPTDWCPAASPGRTEVVEIRHAYPT